MEDAVLVLNDDGRYDLQIDANGDIQTDSFYDTAILYSIFGERRATSSEVSNPRQRRGWIGNGPEFENGSKVWLFYQSRVTRQILSRIADEVEKALQWLVDDGLAVNIEPPQVTVSNGRVQLQVTIRRARDTISRTYNLWEATGRAT